MSSVSGVGINLEVALTAREVELGADQIENAFERVARRAQGMSVEVAEAHVRGEAAAERAEQARREREAREASERQVHRDREVDQERDALERSVATREEIAARAEAAWEVGAADRAARAEQAAEKTGIAEARARVRGLQMQFDADVAKVREAAARGLLSPREAQEAGAEAAAAYNQGLLNVLDTHSALGGRSTSAQQAYAEIAGSIKDVGGEASKVAGTHLVRLSQSLTTMAGNATGANRVLAQTGQVLGSLALGSSPMIGVLAGVSALGFGVSALTRNMRDAREASDEARASLERLIEARRVRELGPGGAIAEELEVSRSDLARVERLIAGERASLTGLPVEIESPRLVRLKREYEELEAVIREGEQVLEDAVAEGARRQMETAVALGEQQRLTAATKEGEDAVREVTAAIARERAVREAAARSSSEQREAAIALAHALRDEVEATEAATRAAVEAAAAAARSKASRESLEDLRLRVEQGERLLEAAREGSEAHDREASVIERSNAVRRAAAGVIAAHAGEAKALAGVIFDLQKAEEAELQAQAVSRDVEQTAARIEHLRAMLALTRDHTGSVEELEAAQRGLAEAFRDRQSVEELISQGWDPAAAQARVDAERKLNAAIEDGTAGARRRQQVEDLVSTRRTELQDMERLIAIHRELGGAQKELEEAVGAYNRELAQRAMIEEVLRAGFEGDLADLEEFVRRYVEAKEELEGLGDAGGRAAIRFQDEWSAALGAISTGVGGLASQLASVGQAFLSGGLLGGAGALGGMALGRIFGGGGEGAREREMAAAVESATESLTRFAERLRETSELASLRAEAGGAFGDAVRGVGLGPMENQIRAAGPYIEALIREGLETEEVFRRLAEGGMFHRKVLEEIEDPLRAYIEALEELERKRQRDVAVMENEFAVRELAAQGRDREAEEMRRQVQMADELARARELEDAALVALIERVHEMESAAREAAEAAARSREAGEFATGLRRLELGAGGDERGLREFELGLQRQRDLDSASDLLDRGIIDEEQFGRFADLLGQVVDQSLADFDQALADAAAAAAERAIRLNEDLDVQILLAEGRREEAELLRLENQFRRDMSDLEDEELRRKREILYELQRENALREELNEELRKEEAGNRLFGGQQMTRIVSPFAAVEEFSRVSATDVLRQIEGNTRRTADNTGRLMVSTTSASGRPIQIIVEQRPGEDGMAFAQRVANHVRLLDEQLEGERVRGERDAGSARIGA